MLTATSINFFYFGLCLLTLTGSSVAAAGHETLCGAELVDALQFVCGERGFYFSKLKVAKVGNPCSTVFLHPCVCGRGCVHVCMVFIK
uniref:Insulin-like domain-containing protein n=1 Tax=Laticauda laticaudata TaxID=8630 RepID=A0A8C5RWC9_LATLA